MSSLFSGKVLITCSLPMNARDTALVIAHTSSGAEALAKNSKRAKVVSAVDAGPLRIARYLEPFTLAIAQLAYEGDEGPERSTSYAEPSIGDYDERRGPLVEYWKSQNGRQSGDPAKLARALVAIADRNRPPRRFIAGADAIAGADQKIADLKAQIEANRDLSTSLAFD
jgi:hypothetical protein